MHTAQTATPWMYPFFKLGLLRFLYTPHTHNTHALTHTCAHALPPVTTLLTTLRCYLKEKSRTTHRAAVVVLRKSELFSNSYYHILRTRMALSLVSLLSLFSLLPSLFLFSCLRSLLFAYSNQCHQSTTRRFSFEARDFRQ